MHGDVRRKTRRESDAKQLGNNKVYRAVERHEVTFDRQERAQRAQLWKAKEGEIGTGRSKGLSGLSTGP